MISFYSSDYIKYFYLSNLETHSSFSVIYCQCNLLKVLTFNFNAIGLIIVRMELESIKKSGVFTPPLHLNCI